MSSILEPGEGFLAGIHAFRRGDPPKKNTFLQRMGLKSKPWYATDIEFSIEEGKVYVAEEVGYGGKPNRVDKDTCKREIYTFPLFKEVSMISGNLLHKRPSSQNPYEPWSSEKAQAYWVERKFTDLFLRIITQRERMMAQLIMEGKITFSVTESIDLKRSAKLSATLNGNDGNGPKWDSATQAHDPIKDITAMCFQVENISGCPPTGIIMDGMTFEMMRSSKKFLDSASVTFSDINIGQNPHRNYGAVLVGTLMAGGCRLEVWVYDGSYLGIDGKSQRFITQKTVVVGDFSLNNPDLKWYFGATDALPAHIDFAERLGLNTDDILDDIANGEIVPTRWVAEDYLQVGLQSAMLCLPSNINMFGVIKVA